jgi:hypothetical protein
MSRMLGLRTSFGLVAALALSSCSGLGGTFSVDRFLNKEITGDTFGACAARSYQAWARHKAWAQVNYAGAAEIAERVQSRSDVMPQTINLCGGVTSDRFAELMKHADQAPERACACGNALVEAERWSCAGPADDKAALQKRFEAAAAACEGR